SLVQRALAILRLVAGGTAMNPRGRLRIPRLLHTLRFRVLTLACSRAPKVASVESIVPRAASDHLHHGLHRPAWLRHRAPAFAPLCQAFRRKRREAGTADGLFFGDAVSFRAGVGPHLGPRRATADPDAGARRLDPVLHAVRICDFAGNG